MGRGEIKSPLLWLAQRNAKNRERLGVHYASDSSGSRHLAAAIWRALFWEQDDAKRIDCPTLNAVRRHAHASGRRSGKLIEQTRALGHGVEPKTQSPRLLSLATRSLSGVGRLHSKRCRGIGVGAVVGAGRYGEQQIACTGG